MRDDIRTSETDERDRLSERPHESRDVGPPGSPLGTDPQEAEPLPGDPREAQQPQEPRRSHVAPGRHDDSARHAGGSERGETGSERSTVDQLREAWDRLRGRD